MRGNTGGSAGVPADLLGLERQQAEDVPREAQELDECPAETAADGDHRRTQVGTQLHI